ncbi:MAG: flagellar protein FlaG [Bacillota bacterium]|uniref:Flagellar biosynthesis protein FlaG n=1 Tax=Thermanaerosceptrum fracticalcis TaxID=1712410 RepID=A0A7G6E496_THEFR|nr:flagellar protein FlaG [Thermanaerosceptrum fracticalcis]QNB46900.1 flagellar biosynthesis protein FlaG [Thermanaerosceptrum fracticalcis]
MRVDGISVVGTNQNTQQNINREVQEPRVKDKPVDNPAPVQNGGENKYAEEELISAIEKANQKFELYEKRLEFSIHEETKQIMIKVINTQTEEVIKEIPPEKILDMVAKMMEMAGLLVDEKA